MVQILLIGIGAGIAAALLFASVISGAVLSIFLFYLSPLPILIAALGWSHWSGLAAALIGAGCLGLVSDAMLFFSFLAAVGAPAWWLGYLALLQRPARDQGDSVEWYPPGRLVLWAAALGAVAVVAGLASLGTDEETIRSSLRSALDRLIEGRLGTPSPPVEAPSEAGRLIELLAIALPPVAAATAAVVHCFNLWLAGRVVRLSHRLTRPWPDLAGMGFPPSCVPLLVAVIAAALLPGLAGLFAGVAAATLGVAFAILGLAVLHAVTRNRSGRGVILTCSYASLAFLGWPALLLALIGVAETLLGLRERAGQRGPPALPPGQTHQ